MGKLQKKRVDIFVPCYNSAKDVLRNGRTLQEFCEENLQKYDWKIIYAENGTDDGTKLLVSALGDIYIHLPAGGRGRTLKYCFENSDADYMIYTDADLAADIRIIPQMVQSLEKGCDIVVGSKYIGNAKYKRKWYRLILSKGFNLFVRKMLGVTFTDSQLGLKAINKTVAKEVVPLTLNNHWFWDTEILYLCEKKHYKRKEIAVTWKESQNSTVKIIRTTISFIIETCVLKLRERRDD